MGRTRAARDEAHGDVTAALEYRAVNVIASRIARHRGDDARRRVAELGNVGVACDRTADECGFHVGECLTRAIPYVHHDLAGFTWTEAALAAEALRLECARFDAG